MPKFETLFNSHWTWRSVLHLSSICTHTLFPWNIAYCFHGAVWEHYTTLLTMTIGYHSNAKLLIHIRSKRPYRRQLFKRLTPLSSTVQRSYPTHYLKKKRRMSVPSSIRTISSQVLPRYMAVVKGVTLFYTSKIFFYAFFIFVLKKCWMYLLSLIILRQVEWNFRW